jgi:hypothetical protein
LDHLALRVLLDIAIKAPTIGGQYKLAALHIELFLKAIEHVRYREVPGENFNGDHLMRWLEHPVHVARRKILSFD